MTQLPVPERTVMDDISQLFYGQTYTPALYVYKTPTVQTALDWAVLHSKLEVSYFETFRKQLPLYTAALEREVIPGDAPRAGKGERRVYVKPGSCPPSIEFASMDWAPTQDSVDRGCIRDWPLFPTMKPTTTWHILEETHKTLFMKCTWCRNSAGDSWVLLFGMFSHLCFDGTARTDFMRLWANMHRHLFEDGKRFVLAEPPIVDHSILVGATGNAEAGHDIKVERQRWTEEREPVWTELGPVFRILFPKSCLEKWQANALKDLPPEESKKITKNDLLVAFMWSFACRHSRTPCISDPASDTSMLIIPLNVRGRYPKVTDSHFGNMVAAAPIVCPAITKQKLSQLAQRVHEAVASSATLEAIQKGLDQQAAIPLPEAGTIPGLAVVNLFNSWRHLNLYDAVFGSEMGDKMELMMPLLFNMGMAYSLPVPPKYGAQSQVVNADEAAGLVYQISFAAGDSEDELLKAMEQELPDGAAVLGRAW